MASGDLEKLLNGVRKNRVKYFASGVHKEYGYQKMNQNIKSSLMGVYDRFTLQSFDLLNGGTQFIKASQSFGLLDGVFNSLSLQSLKSKGLPLKDILCYPKG